MRNTSSPNLLHQFAIIQRQKESAVSTYCKEILQLSLKISAKKNLRVRKDIYFFRLWLMDPVERRYLR